MKSLTIYLTIFLSSLLVLSCSDSTSSVDGGEENGGPYVIAATPIALEGVADYLVNTGSLTSGRVSLIDNGIEQDGTYRYYVTHNNTYFSMLYGQGSPGAVTAYRLNNSGQLEKVSDFRSATVHAFAPVNHDILMMRVPRDINEPTAHW